MKIGVLTYWYGNGNYGMILQCWALQQYLKRKGHDTFVIRYIPKGSWLRNTAKKMISFLYWHFSGNYRFYHKNNNANKGYILECDKKRKFEEFRNSHLLFSNAFYKHLHELRRNPPQADCYIAGSDQIWSCHLKLRDSWAYYLNFGSKCIKKISYAPSFGRREYPKHMLKKLSEALSNFNSLSCRENDGVKICNQAGYQAIKVEDPTLLLKKEDYDAICIDVPYSNYIFIYSVNMRAASDIYWTELRNEFNDEQVIVTPASGSIEGAELFGKDVDYVYATPGEWLGLVRNSDMVITSSFHGVVFSIIYNKKFAFVPLKGTYAASNNRITDLLESLCLTELIIKKPDDYKYVKDLVVDWEAVNDRKERLMVASELFLNDSLAAENDFIK